MSKFQSPDDKSTDIDRENHASKMQAIENAKFPKTLLDNERSCNLHCIQEQLKKDISSLKTEEDEKELEHVTAADSNKQCLCYNHDGVTFAESESDNSDDLEEAEDLAKISRGSEKFPGYRNNNPSGKEIQRELEKAEGYQPKTRYKKAHFNIYASSFIPKTSTSKTYSSQQRVNSRFRPTYQPYPLQRRPYYLNYQASPYPYWQKQQSNQIRRSTLPSRSTKNPEESEAQGMKETLWQEECPHPQCHQSRKLALRCYNNKELMKNYLSQESITNVSIPQKQSSSQFLNYMRYKVTELINNNPQLSVKAAEAIASIAWFSSLSVPDYIAHRQKIPVRAQISEASETSQSTKLSFKSAYKLFKLDHIAKLKDAQPQLAFKERIALMKEMWKQLPSDSKYVYVKRSRLDKKRALLKHQLEGILSAQKDLKGILATESKSQEPSYQPEDSLPAFIVESLTQ